MYIVNVLIEYKNINLDRTFSYVCKTKLPLYTRVLVNFNNKEVIGFVLEVKDYQPQEFEIKEIIKVIDDKPIINNELYSLALFMQQKYLVTLMQALSTILPIGMKPSHKDKAIINQELHYEIISSKEKISVLQEDILMELKQRKVLRRKDLVKEYSEYNINTLVKKGYLKKKYEAKQHVLVDEASASLPALNVEQNEVYQTIINTNNQAFLLHGVTGSGKTIVYLHLAQYYINQGKTVLILVPEITLTLMMQQQFASIFQNKIAILHSRLSDAMRYQEYLKIKNKEVSIVVGTRSSIFAPLNNIGIIIIDEEHDNSYKQKNQILYHTDDLALFRANKHQANIVLASATPRIISLARAYKRQYTYLTLKKRYQNAPLPKIELVDLNKQEFSIVSKKTMVAIKKELQAHKQVVILLNRRGYNTLTSCRDCQKVIECPNCNIALTYHSTTNTLKCHHCDYEQANINECPECHSHNLKRVGIGIQKIEEYLIKELHNYQVLRIDQDTSKQVQSLNKKLKEFNDGKYQVLIGTQMVAKGLNFEKVDLSVVLNIDASLAFNHYNANEQAFQLLVQIAGRAGRFSQHGHVLVETWQPEHYLFKYLIRHDYLGFFKHEMMLAKKYQQPPYYYYCLLTLIGLNELEVKNEAANISEYLKENINEIVFDAKAAPLYRFNNQYRYQILIKYKQLTNISEPLLTIKKMISTKKGLSLIIDTNY